MGECSAQPAPAERGEMCPHAASASSSSDSKHSNPQTPSKKKTNNNSDKEHSASGDKNPATAANHNRVYKYFSNPARWEFSRRRKSFPEEIKLPGVKSDVEDHAERTCFHLGDKICPICDAPLRNYESCCLRCQKKLSLKLCSRRRVRKSQGDDEGGDEHHHSDGEDGGRSSNDSSATFVVRQLKTAADSFALVCVSCERLYSLCADCVRKSDVCRACHRKRNVCMHCRRTLCAFCLDEIASGRDTEPTHLNQREEDKTHPVAMSLKDHDKEEAKVEQPSVEEESLKIVEKPIAPNESSFLVLADSDSSSSSAKHLITSPASLEGDNKLPNNLRQRPTTAARQPLPLQFKRNTTQRLPKIMAKELSFIVQHSPPPTAIRMAHQAVPPLKPRPGSDDPSDSFSATPPLDGEQQRHLVRPQQTQPPQPILPSEDSVSNDSASDHGAASQHRSTQTQPPTAGRRDVILYEDNNLAMPLLHEMPKMMRSAEEEAHLLAIWQQKNWLANKRNREQTVNGKKSYISSTYPHVYTQIGAFRSQLQTSQRS